MAESKSYLVCCCCGNGAGRWHQHWNRDTGYGVCRDCLDTSFKNDNAESLESQFGKAGWNYEGKDSDIQKQYDDLVADSQKKINELKSSIINAKLFREKGDICKAINCLMEEK